MITKSEFTQELNDLDTHFPSWRYGQCAFNLMYKHYPHIANEFRASIYDPFYNDERVEEFIDKCFEKIEDLTSE